jgi:hypothetical protein
MVKECTKFFSLLSAGLKHNQSVERTKTVQVLDILLFDYLFGGVSIVPFFVDFLVFIN